MKSRRLKTIGLPDARWQDQPCCGSPFPSSSGSRAMLAAIRRDPIAQVFAPKSGKLEGVLTRRNPMRSRIFLLALVSAALMGVTERALAQSPYSYPWCSKQIYRGSDATSCYFASYAQCMTTVSGIGGWCYQNPAYNGARNSVPARRRRLLIDVAAVRCRVPEAERAIPSDADAK
jgi:Protein of unknown function (DUF3551)